MTRRRWWRRKRKPRYIPTCPDIDLLVSWAELGYDPATLLDRMEKRDHD